MLKKTLAQGSLLLPFLLLGGFLLVPACSEKDAGTDEDAPDPPGACEGEEPLYLLADSAGGAGGAQGEHELTDEESGLVECSDGRINLERTFACGEPLTFDLTEMECDEWSYTDLDDDPNASYPYYPEVCGQIADPGCDGAPCLVEVGCRDDADCEEWEFCLCATEAQVASRCVRAECKSDDDCPSGECGALEGPCPGAILTFACRTAEDECATNDDCPDNQACRLDSRERRICTTFICE